jgi:putative ABC transport system substrate-binding protein
MRRREFITLVGGSAAAWPFAARAQQRVVPVIGYLSTGSPESDVFRLKAFQQGLNQTGYFEDQNVTIRYRWARGEYARLPALADDMVRRQMTVIYAMSTASALAAKEATTTIPIVFNISIDPVTFGLVTSLSQPGGNATGIALLNIAVMAKRLELLRELVPTAGDVALLVNPTSRLSESETREAQDGARSLGLQLQVVNASNENEIHTAFATYREFASVGGLMAYGTNVANSHRQCGIYTGHILDGKKPADLPVQQVTKVELVINLKTAKAFGLSVPPTLLARADEVID